MKLPISLFLLLISITSFSQQKENPTITVIGIARMTVTPDLGTLNISVSEIRLQMGDAIKALEVKSNHYNELLKELGFSEKDIKTTSFSVNQYRVYREREYIDSGYIASQKIKLEFQYDQKTLQKILTEFSKSEKPIDFSFDFQLSEQLKQKVQSQILDYAVKDGNEKANLIAKSAGLKLLRIKDIAYGTWGRDAGMQLVEKNRPYASYSAAGNDSRNINFTPDDLVLRDTVMLIWQIE